MSYHNRNVPVLCTIEMSPSCRFTKPQKRSAFSFADIDLFSTDDQAPECRIWVSGMGARGKGQRPFLAHWFSRTSTRLFAGTLGRLGRSSCSSRFW